LGVYGGHGYELQRIPDAPDLPTSSNNNVLNRNIIGLRNYRKNLLIGKNLKRDPALDIDGKQITTTHAK